MSAGAVSLRPVQAADLDAFHRHQLDDEARRQAAFVTEAPADRARFDAHWARLLADPGVRVCTVLADGANAGHVSSYRDGARRELTYWIDPTLWGRGIASRAVAAFVAAEPAGVLHARVVQDHVASLKVLQRCGFQVCGQDSGFAAGRGAQVEEFLLQRPPGGAAAGITTTRLRLEPLVLDDAAFVVELLNEPGWLQHIGDRGVRSIADAQRYLIAGPMAMQAKHGLGVWRVTRRDDGVAVGVASLLRRELLPGADLGYALLARHEGRGYAREAAKALLAWGQREHGLQRTLAVVSPVNTRSVALLTGMGFRFEREFAWEAGADLVALYACEAAV